MWRYVKIEYIQHDSILVSSELLGAALWRLVKLWSCGSCGNLPKPYWFKRAVAVHAQKGAAAFYQNFIHVLSSLMFFEPAKRKTQKFRFFRPCVPDVQLLSHATWCTICIYICTRQIEVMLRRRALALAETWPDFLVGCVSPCHRSSGSVQICEKRIQTRDISSIWKGQFTVYTTTNCKFDTNFI